MLCRKCCTECVMPFILISYSRQEFANYLNSLDVFFSRKKWNQVFRDICIYRNNKISFDEFSLFLFPNHGVVLVRAAAIVVLSGCLIDH